MNRFSLVLLLLWPLSMAQAAIDVYQFDTPRQEERFRQLTEQLRCPKCQNQSIGDSDAQIAQDMRERVARMIREGKTNEQIVDYFVARYGAFVNYKPPVTARTLMLWGGPALIFVTGLFLVLWQLRRAARAAEREERS